MQLKTLEERIERLEAHKIISAGIDNGIDEQIERLKIRKAKLLEEIEDYKKLHGEEGNKFSVTINPSHYIGGNPVTAYQVKFK